MKKIVLQICILLFIVGCSPSRHHGHIYIKDPNHYEVVFDRPMSMSIEKDGTKIEASSLKPGFFEEMLKFMLLRPR